MGSSIPQRATFAATPYDALHAGWTSDPLPLAEDAALRERINPNLDALADQAKADALAQTLRRAFEPGHGPDRASQTAAAAEVSVLFDEINASYQKWIYADPNQERA